MKKKYLYKGSIYSYDDINSWASKNNMSFGDYVSQAGIQEVDDEYEYKGQKYSAEKMLESAKQNESSFTDYITATGATPVSVVKKKETQSVPQLPNTPATFSQKLLFGSQAIDSQTGDPQSSSGDPLTSKRKAPANFLEAPDYNKEIYASIDNANKRLLAEEVNQLSDNIYTGTVEQPQLTAIYKKPGGKQIISNLINQYAPTLGDKWMDGDLWNNLEKWDQLTRAIQTANRSNGVAALKTNMAELDARINDIAANFKKQRVSVSGGTGGAAANVTETDLPLVNESDPGSYGRLLNLVSSDNDVLVPKSGKGKQQDKQELIKLINQRSLLLSANKQMSPEIEERSDRIGIAIGGINQQISQSKNISFELADKHKSDNESHFKNGLNHIKDTHPGWYKNIITAIDEKGIISKNDYRDISSVGQEISNIQKFQSSATDPNLLGSETAIDYRTDEDIKQQYAKVIGERAKAAGIKNVSTFSKKTIKSLGVDLPYQNVVDQLADEEQIRGYDAIPKTGAVTSFAEGLAEPFIGIGQTLQVMTQSPVQTYLDSRRTDAGSAQLVVDDKGQLTKKLPSDKGNVWYEMLHGAGQFLPQVFLARGVGGAIGKVASADARIALTANQLNNLKTFSGTVVSTFAQEYGNSYADAIQKTGDAGTARLIAGIDGISAAAFETILPDVKIADNIARGFRKELNDDLIALIRKGGDPSELARKARPFIQKFVTNTINTAGQEVAEEVGTTVVDYVTEAIFSPRTAVDRNLANEVMETARATAISMALPSIFGGAGQSVNKDFSVSGLHSAAINLGLYKNDLNKAVDNGLISPEERDKSIKLLNTHAESIMYRPMEYEDGTAMTGQDGLEYAYQNTISKYFKEKVNQEKEHGNDEVQIEFYESKAKQAEDAKRGIFTKGTLSDAESSAIEEIGKIDLSNTGFKLYADVINDPAATTAQKKAALKGISDQLLDPETAETTDTQIGAKAADAIYNLGYEAPQTSNFRSRLNEAETTQSFEGTEAEGVSAVQQTIAPPTQVNEEDQEKTASNDPASLSPENKSKYDQLDQEIFDLDETITREGGLNARIEQADDEDNVVRANNLRQQREAIYSQMLAKTKEQESLFNVESPAVGESMQGRIIRTANSGTWQVVDDLGDRVRLFNPANNATIVTGKDQLPASTQLDERGSEIAQRFGVDDATAAEIQNILSQPMSREDATRRIKELLGATTQAGASESSVPLTANTENAPQDETAQIAEATTNFANQQRPELEEVAARNIEDARAQLENDGGVVWQEFPNGERMDVGEPGGAAAGDVNNRESRDRQGNERLHNFGFGLYNGSSEKSPAGQSLFEVLTGEGYSDRQRGMAAAYIAAQRLLNNSSSNFIGRLFARAANKSTSPRGRIRIYYNEDPTSGIINAGGGVVSINAYKLGQRLKEFGGEQRFFAWLDAALSEEVVHLATGRVATDQELTEVFDEMSPEQKEAVQALYGGQSLTPAQTAMEFIRQVFQEKVFGTATELLKPKESALTKIRAIARKLLAYIKRSFTGQRNQLATNIIGRIENFIAGNDEANSEGLEAAATEAGTSDDSNLDDLIGDMWERFGKKPRIRFTQYQWQQQAESAQEQQSDDDGSYQFGQLNTDILTSFVMTRQGDVDKIFGTEKTVQRLFNEMTTDERFQAQTDMLKDGKEMIGAAQIMFGADIIDYGPKLFGYIRVMPESDHTLSNKKAVLMATFLGELKQAMLRNAALADQLRPLHDQVFRYYRNFMHVTAKNLSAGRLLELFRDKYLSDIFADQILEDEQADAARDIKDAEVDVEISDEDLQNASTGRQARSTKDVTDEQKAADQKKRDNTKKDKARKPGKKDQYQKVATDVEAEINKKYGSKGSLATKIIDMIKKLKCP